MTGKRYRTDEYRTEFGFGWSFKGDHWRTVNLTGCYNVVLLFPRTPHRNCWTVRAYRKGHENPRGLFCEMVLRGRDAERRAFFHGSSLSCGATTHSAKDDL